MIGTSLGPYRIDRELGAGGMGKVYAATVERKVGGLAPGTPVALKVVHPHLLETEGFFRRFLREAEIGRAVVHENVVRTLDCDSLTTDGRRADFLVMEYVEGQTLRALLEELDRVPEELCRHIGREIAKGLVAIHAAGVVHRDMKPENVLITADQVVKVMDLGVARLVDESLRLSQSGAFVGSVEYAAPEQFGGTAVDHRADLYAVGLILYELACAQHPFRAGDFRSVMRRVCDEEPTRVGDVNPQLSPFFEEVVHTLLAKKPEDRFADAAALLAVLEAGERSAWWRARERSVRAATKRPLRRIRIPRETAVYGRDTELALLRSHFVRATKGDGQVVLVEGEAGIGKSRLVDEFVGRLLRDGEDLNFLFGSYPPGGAATAAGAFSTAYREQFGDAGSRDYLPQSPILAPAFDALLRGETAPSAAEPLTKDSLQTCFVQTTRGLAAERPTVVLIDDLHFAPDEGRALFTSLALAVPGHRVLLVGTTRPGIDEKWLADLTRLEQTTRTSLARLGPKDLVALLQDSFRSPTLASALAAQIAVKSDGNPFFAFEIIRGLREGQFITQRDDGTWVSTRVIDDIRIPSSVLDLVNARVADLAEEERDLLDVAACWGYEFDPTLVADAVGASPLAALKSLGLIERRHRLVRSNGRDYVFDHHQVQEALYGGLNERLREMYHAALAGALERRSDAAGKDPETLGGALCVDLCEHFLRAAQGERALRYLVPAQSHLTQGYLHAQVAALTERALAAPGLLAGAARADALLRLAAALGPMGRRARQEECAKEAERLAGEAGDEELRGRAARELGSAFLRTSRHAEAVDAFGRALAIALARGDRRAEARLTGNLGGVHFSRGSLAEAKEHYERQLALSREIGYRDGEADATGNLGAVLFSQGRLDEAKEHHGRQLALCREIGDREGVVMATGNLGVVHSAQGRLAESKECHERALALCREIGDRYGEAVATGNLGLVLESQGRLAEAAEHEESALALCRETGNRDGETTTLANLGVYRLLLGDLARAREALETAVALSRRIGSRFHEGYVLLSLGRTADEEGDVQRARALVEESLALRRQIRHDDGVALSLLMLAEIRLREGDADAVRGALEEALALSREQGRQAQVARALCLLARLPGGDVESAREALVEAEESRVAPGLRLDLWKATGDRAELVAARRLLDELLAKNPPEFHEAMRKNVRVNREIVDACRAEGI